jgi:SAM-dependent methyltransferase
VRDGGAEPAELDELRGDRQTQHDVLEALAECANHRRWFAAFARPYLGEHPVEIGSGFGDYAKQWIPLADKFTATEADPALLPGLKAEMAAFSNVEVSLLQLPTHDHADHSALIAYNVLEHIDDHVAALESMARLVRPEGHIILVCPAFPFAMSPVDIATGHVRRYTRRSMSKALTDAGLEIVDVRYANSLGLICYYAFTSVLKRQPKIGGTISFYDRLLVPIIRLLERIVGRPPFGQSVVAIARVPEEADQADG